jgi:hypothetical protein
MARAKAKSAGAVAWKGPPELRPLLRPVGELRDDPENVNTHDERSVAGIAASYDEYGQQKPLVADADGVVRAGNGQLEAVRRLGWTHVAVVRSDLEGARLTAFAVVDNKLAGRSRFDEVRLLDLLEGLESAGIAPQAVDFDPEEVQSLIDQTRGEPAAAGAGRSPEKADRTGARSDRMVRVRPVLFVGDVAAVEQALRRTGLANRGEALVEVYRAYLRVPVEHQGQLDPAAEGEDPA